jgi:hypothetical protein
MSSTMTPPSNPRLEVATRLLAGMLANPTITATAPGITFVLQEALDLTDRLLQECPPQERRLFKPE